MYNNKVRIVGVIDILFPLLNLIVNKVFVLVIVFCSYLHYTELLPIPEPQTVWTNVNTGDRTAETEFMVNNGVTQEEIEEFHRLSKYIVSLTCLSHCLTRTCFST